MSELERVAVKGPPGWVWLRKFPLTIPLLLLTLAILFPLYSGSDYWLRQGSLIATLALVVSGINLSFGYAGEVQFGQIFMFAAGAYLTMGIATKANFTDIIALLVIGGMIAGIIGLVVALCATRIGGWSLAMLSFFLVVTIPDFAVVLQRFTGGEVGLVGIPTPTLFGTSLGFGGLYEVAVCAAGVWLLCFRNLVTSRYGIIFRILRESPVLSNAQGFSPRYMKTLAYAIGAVPAGVAGCLYGFISFTINPDDFGLSLAIGAVAASVLGGVESVYGAVVGAAILQLGPEESLSFAQYAPIAYGLFLVVAAVAFRRGIGGLASAGLAKVSSRLGWTVTADIVRQGEDAEQAQADESLDELLGRRSNTPRAGLVVEAVSKSFGGVQALRDVSVKALPGQVTALIGANGSGKTTLLNAICGFTKPTSGRIHFAGSDLTGLTPHRIARMGVARTFQTTKIPSGVSVLGAVSSGHFRLDHCGIWASMLRLPRHYRALTRDRTAGSAALRLAGLTAFSEVEASSLPLGMRRLVEVARALCGQPALLLLDEPASGLSSDEMQRLARLIRSAASRGVAVVLIEHNFAFVSDLADQVHVLGAGRLLASGTASAVAADPKVIDSYLGEGAPASAAVRRRPKVSADAEPALEVVDLESGYGDLQVLRGVSFTAKPATVSLVLGRNGVGKTTLLHAIAGQVPAWQGKVTINGRNVTHKVSYRRVSDGLAMVQEGKRIFHSRSIWENVLVGTYSLRISLHDRRRLCEDLLAQFPMLSERRREKAGSLSGGQQQMLAIVQALASRPSVLLLDEPSIGLAPTITDDVFQRIRQLADDGLTVVLVEQLASRALPIADDVIVLDAGRVVASGAADEFNDLTQLHETYFEGA
jgi:branched-chain amino acid transport system permease protein